MFSKTEISQTSSLMCKNMELLNLAFIGDAVHTLFVREFVSKKYNYKMNGLNKEANKFCKASAQAKTLERISSLLTDEEKEIVRKTRNIKNKHKAKNTDIMTYKFATCYEALVGYHYTNKNEERLAFLLNCSLEGEN